MAGEINLYDSDGVKQRKIAVDDTSKRVEIRDAEGTDIMDIEAHASRHQAGGDDEVNLNAMKAEGDPAYIKLIDTGSGGAERRIVSDGGHAKVYDDTGAEVMDIEAHASRHVSGGDDAISGLTYDQLASDTIIIEAPFPVPDSQQSGLAADSTGVKWTSVFKGRWNKRHLKKVRIRATWSASHTDSETKIAVKDINSGNDIVSVSGNAGTNQEAEATDLTNVTDAKLFEVYAEVTTASGTSGATFDVSYVVVELVYGVS